jgi:hypothetical protein
MMGYTYGELICLIVGNLGGFWFGWTCHRDYIKRQKTS